MNHISLAIEFVFRQSSGELVCGLHSTASIGECMKVAVRHCLNPALIGGRKIMEMLLSNGIGF